MTPREQHALAVELAVWNADQIRRFGTFIDSPAGPLLDSAGSPFARACYTLWGLGSATVTDAAGGPPRGDHGAPPPHFQLADEPDIRRAMAGREIKPKEFSRLLGDCIDLQAHTPDAFQLTGDWIEPCLPRPLLDALVAAQFLYCADGRCRWTDLMAQWVEWAAPSRHWESEAESRARRLRKYGPIWESMPPAIRFELVRSGELDRLRLPDAIRRFWDGERWHERQLPDWDEQQRLVDAMLIGDNIKRLIDEGELRLQRLSTFWKWAKDL